ncbi:ImpA family type VI secretion system protein [Burkholderia diffusa]|uniref:type VI secretion system protein TssA n=1 Tax=Burkholderia diffusa TaxID=488732 RepID=UPI0008417116|nr:type VI secretion system ImpA family N-terminal domain-containing protein [Burkholderia diffusa]AOI60338.1 type VI secretion protein ImpA [Burkholderia diffusa]
MSKKQNAKQTAPDHASAKGAAPHDWLAPISDGAPCGPDLEYDHDFVVIFASAAPKQDVQYGAFVGSPDPVNWSEIERDCLRLMARTKDIRVAVLYTRCRTRLGGAAGLAEGVGLLAAWLLAFAEHIHPQSDTGNERDAALDMRMNALQALADPDGLLADVREIVLAKSTLARLQVRDVERAFAVPRSVDALALESVAQQLRDLRARQPAVMSGFDNAIASLDAIDAWSARHLEAYRPDLSLLTGLLAKLGVRAETAAPEPIGEPVEAAPPMETATKHDATETPAAASPDPASVFDAAPARPTSEPVDREAALALIRMARTWFDAHEPSSPIPVLLNRAERFAGKRYAEIVKAIPHDLLVQWEETDDA